MQGRHIFRRLVAVTKSTPNNFLLRVDLDASFCCNTCSYSSTVACCAKYWNERDGFNYNRRSDSKGRLTSSSSSSSSLINYKRNICSSSTRKMCEVTVPGMRKPYKGNQETFDLHDLVSKEPFGQFNAWFEEAKVTPGIMEANAMALATATREGIPSVRMVLMKGLSKEGIDFYTNYLSRKADELLSNPHCNLMFYWEPLMRSVRIEGRVEKLSTEHSSDYFHSRPRSSQIGACVSEKQSSVIPSRQVLDKRKEDLEIKYADDSVEIPKPDYWGGFRVVPHKYEFWQGQTNRIHDRIVFRKPSKGETIDPSVTFEGSEGWVYERLQP